MHVSRNIERLPNAAEESLRRHSVRRDVPMLYATLSWTVSVHVHKSWSNSHDEAWPQLGSAFVMFGRGSGYSRVEAFHNGLFMSFDELKLFQCEPWKSFGFYEMSSHKAQDYLHHGT